MEDETYFFLNTGLFARTRSRKHGRISIFWQRNQGREKRKTPKEPSLIPVDPSKLEFHNRSSRPQDQFRCCFNALAVNIFAVHLRVMRADTF
jgi:hypothetical protein